MKGNKPTGKRSAKPDAKTVQRLLKQAMKNPGVRELVEVYENWQRLDRPAQAYRQVMAPRSIVSLSDTSAPTP